MSYSWIKFRAKNLRNPAFRRLFALNPIYLLWWIEVCLIAAEADEDGKLIYGRGHSWIIDDIANLLHESADAIKNFVDTCLSLDLLEVKDDFFCLVSPDDWYGIQAMTNAERQKRHRDKEKAAKTDLALNHSNGKVTVSNGAPLQAVTQSNDPNKKQSRIRIREEKEAEQSSARAREPACLASLFQNFEKLALPASVPTIAPGYSEEDFWSTCQVLHARLTGSAEFSTSSKRLVAEMLDSPAWQQEPSWHVRAAALELASQRALHRVEQGEKVRKRWPWLLRWAEEHLAPAAQQCQTAEFAASEGFNPAPLRWTE